MINSLFNIMARKASRKDVKLNKRLLWRKPLRGPRLNQTPPRKSHSNTEKKKGIFLPTRL
jgi:hypothetical protein